MTTVEITLPDQLAQEAAQAGLLAPAAIESLLREKLKTKRREKLFEEIDFSDGESEPGYMSPEEVAKEIALMRAERRAANSAG